MIDAVTHTNVTIPLAGSGLASAVGVVFGIDLIAIWCALIGAFFGLAFRPARPDDLDHYALAIRFLTNTAYVAATTIATAFLMSLVITYISQKNAYPISFFGGMALMVFREKVIDGAGRLIDAFFNRSSKKVGGE